MKCLKRLWRWIFPPALWTPFDKDGYMDRDRLAREGWYFMGAYDERCFGCGEINKPGCPTGECCR